MFILGPGPSKTSCVWFVGALMSGTRGHVTKEAVASCVSALGDPATPTPIFAECSTPHPHRPDCCRFPNACAQGSLLGELVKGAFSNFRSPF